MKIYLIADYKGDKDRFFKKVEELLDGGIDLLQLRAKKVEVRELYKIVEHILKLTEKYSVPFIINDYWEIATEFPIQGVHLGKEDFSPTVLRTLLPKKIIGYTVNSIDDLKIAENAKVDYVGVGSIFETKTKEKSRVKIIGIEGLKKILEKTSIPVYAIGGITSENAKELVGLKIEGIALSSYLIEAENPLKSLKELKKILIKSTSKERKTSRIF